MTWCFASTLTRYHTNNKMKTATHTGANRMTCTYKYILTPPVLYSKQLSVLHSINNQIHRVLQCLGYSKIIDL